MVVQFQAVRSLMSQGRINLLGIIHILIAQRCAIRRPGIDPEGTILRSIRQPTFMGV